MARRRGEQKGHLYRKGPSWLIQFREDVIGADGRPGQKLVTKFVAPAAGVGAVNKKKAQGIATEEYLSALARISKFPKSMLPLRDFVANHFEPEHVLGLKPSGKAHYDLMLRVYILPKIGEKRMRDIMPSVVMDLIRGVKAAGKSDQTAAHVRNALSSIFRHAKSMGWWSGDLPTESIRLKLVRKKRRALTWEQILLVVKNIQPLVLPKKSLGKKRDIQIQELVTQYKLLTLLMPITGLRIGEVLGLQWKHMNSSAAPIIVNEFEVSPGCLLVEQGITRRPKRFRSNPQQIETPKTKASVRIVPVPEWLLRPIANLKERGDFTGPDDPIFATRNGQPLNGNNMARRILKPIGELKDVNMPWLTWHCFRHSAASLQDQGGVTLAERRRTLGHAGDEIALHYTHMDAALVRTKMEAMVDFRAAESLLVQ